MPTLPETLLAMTGTPEVIPSTITLAPPSITLEMTITLALRMRRRVSPCVRAPSQRYRRTDGHLRAAVANMNKPHGGIRRQPRNRAHRGQRILFGAHVTDQNHVEGSVRWR